jgi:hypothetical protein
VTLRLWLTTESDLYIQAGVPMLLALAAGLGLTTFTRREEYSGPPAATAPATKASLARRIVGLPLALARLVVNYPAWIVYVALADRIDLYFWVYGVTVTVYAAKTFAGACLKLGRFRESDR